MVPDSSTAAKPKRILLVTPPLLQPNTPYPATPVLAGFLQAQGFEVAQADLSLELLLRLFSAQGVRQVAAAMRRRGLRRTPATRHFLRHAGRTAAVVEPVVAFLQGGGDAVAARILAGGWLPEGPRFANAECGVWHAECGTRNAECKTMPGGRSRLLDARGRSAPHSALVSRARHLASLFLDDLADAIRDGVDPRFGFARYAEHLAVAAPRFDPLLRALAGRPTLVDRLLDDLTDAALAQHRPALVGLTVPFPGTLYGALRIARRIRRQRPRTRIALGGGYVNTELRELDDPRVFEFVDAICLDDGEEPLLRLAQRAAGMPVPLVRTMVRQRKKVVGVGCQASAKDLSPNTCHPTPEPCIPAYAALALDRYLPLAESTNPMHRLWSDRRWLKLPLAHGCYWHRCRFCDTALDYIGRYAPPRPDAVVDVMAELRRRTGLDGFHFTDEALAPALLRQVSERLLARRVRCTWWGNIRFERAFTRELARTMARAGCVAVTGGLECAHDRLLAQMGKGITLQGAARACKAFAGTGILVHAYLMYGFPTQTLQETVDGLEYVRQLFAAGLVRSAYWHRFALTCHSPIAAAPEAFGIRIRQPRATPGRTFARNELVYEEVGRSGPPRAPCGNPATGLAGDGGGRLGVGLRRATYNYMLGRGIDEPANAWFDFDAPEATLPEDFVARA